MTAEKALHPYPGCHADPNVLRAHASAVHGVADLWLPEAFKVRCKMQTISYFNSLADALLAIALHSLPDNFMFAYLHRLYTFPCESHSVILCCCQAVVATGIPTARKTAVTTVAQAMALVMGTATVRLLSKLASSSSSASLVCPGSAFTSEVSAVQSFSANQ